MVRKVSLFFAVLLILLTATCGAVSAETYSPYEGNISTSYLTYFEDILPKIKLNDHYVFLRSGQNQYSMIVGDINFSNGVFTSGNPCTVYSMSSTNSYNSYYSYNVSTIDTFSMNPSDILVYSDLGNFPELEERGNKYAILQTILICVFLLACVVRSIFFSRKR